MYSYDIRVILFIMVFSIITLRISKIQFSQIRTMVIYVLIFVVTNTVISFFFSPEMGVEIYGTRHPITKLFGSIYLTQEQILYQSTKFLKYFAVIPLGMIFLLTTNPSEFASSINRVGVPYKGSYAVALTLRYYPDIQRDYRDISLAQQARGLDLSKKAKLKDRFKNAVLIVIPLIFSTLDRIEMIANAMDLRGFGKDKKRTWYTSRKLNKQDYAAIAISAILFFASLGVSLFINHSRFFNPFI
jgi:energy-coupling factor transport system permease protein